MHSYHAVVHLPAVAVPLPFHAHCVVAALADPGFIHDADRLRMAVFLRHHLLAAVVEFLFIPLD
jgi:hypothetical protein